MKRIIWFLAFFSLSFHLIGQDKEFQPQSQISIQTNILATTHFNFTRQVSPLGSKSILGVGLEYIMGTGFGFGAHWIAPELSILSFGPKHYLETGLSFAFPMYEGENLTDEASPGLRLSYRYQTRNKLFYRISIQAYFALDPPVLPALGLGWNF